MIPNNLPKREDIFGSNMDEPIPHYPNWLYHCPTCHSAYEMDVKFWGNGKFLSNCPDCVKKILNQNKV